MGATHSQTPDVVFAHFPGIKIVAPGTPYDAKGLLKTAIRDNNPVVFLWHRMMYGWMEELPEEEWIVPLGESKVRREGADVTVVASGYMVHRVISAAEKLAGETEVEVIDLRTIVPMDLETILASVAKTGRLVVVHEANACCGVGAEIVRRVAEERFDALISPPKVVGGRGVPMPFSEVLENACVPQETDIIKAIQKAIGHNNAK